MTRSKVKLRGDEWTVAQWPRIAGEFNKNSSAADARGRRLTERRRRRRRFSDISTGSHQGGFSSQPGGTNAINLCSRICFSSCAFLSSKQKNTANGKKIDKQSSKCSLTICMQAHTGTVDISKNMTISRTRNNNLSLLYCTTVTSSESGPAGAHNPDSVARYLLSTHWISTYLDIYTATKYLHIYTTLYL